MTDENTNARRVRFDPSLWAWRLNLGAGFAFLAAFVHSWFGSAGWFVVGGAVAFGFWALLYPGQQVYRWGAVNLAFSAGWSAAFLWLNGQPRFAWPCLFLAGTWWLLGFLPKQIRFQLGGGRRRRHTYGEPLESDMA